jgi:tRNA(Ile)-lysidine synthase
VPVDGERAWLLAQGQDAYLLVLALTAHGSLGDAPLTIGVAVSGGSDSMALLHLLARAAPHAGWTLRAVTLDHRLRPAAAEEAAFAGSVCRGLGVPHDVLVWDHGEITGNLMEAAREARYRLIAEWAKAQGVGMVMVAHTADDQAEGFLIGLSRAAGLDGLSGMRRQWMQDGITFRRPLLSETKAELQAYLVRHGLQWVEDPSNADDRFTRVKARRALKALKPLGITVDRLSAVIHNLSMAQSAVRQAVWRAGEKAVTEVAGSLRFEYSVFHSCGHEVQRRLLIAMVRWIGSHAHPPRQRNVISLETAVLQRKDATLSGVRFRWTGDTCIVTRELRAVGGPVAVGALWDGRWRISGPPGRRPAPGQGLEEAWPAA